jgi:hypothetical protein
MTVSTRPFLAAIFAAALADSAAHATALAPKDLVRQLYAEPTATLDAVKARRYFAADLDSSLRGGSESGPMGSFNFDYRYGAQALDVSGLQFIEQDDNDEAKVVVVFKNYGRPESVDWLLCRRPDGDWRIADASSNTERNEWDLRDLVRLARTPVRC